MDLSAAVVLGVVQGVLEWLPVSSSAYSVFLMLDGLGLDAQTAFSFSVYLHLGTLLAAVLRFRGRLIAAARSVLSGKKSKLMSFIVIATVSSAVGGFPAYFFLKGSFLEQQGSLVMFFVGLLLVVTGLVLFYARGRFGFKSVDEMSSMDPAAVGFLQGLAVLPGLSRSGVTLAALLLRRFKQKEALELSFIMSIPAVLGLVFVETLGGGFMAVDLSAGLAGVLASFVVGYLAIDFLVKNAQKVRFDLFCMLFGLLAAASSAAALLLS